MENPQDNEIRKIRSLTGLSRAAFSRKYNIPIRTLENWELRGENHYPDYIPALLSRCVEQGLYILPIIDTSITELRASLKLSRAAFSRKYNIPLRTIEDWEYGRRTCPQYVFELILRCVKFDELPPYFVLTLNFFRKDEYKKVTSGGCFLYHASDIHFFVPENIIKKYGYLTERGCHAAITAIKKDPELLGYTACIVKKDKLLKILSQLEWPKENLVIMDEISRKARFIMKARSIMKAKRRMRETLERNYQNMPKLTDEEYDRLKMLERGYQIMPELTDKEYDRLKKDIEKNGCKVPVDVDEKGNILDGYHRAMICDKLGIEYETNVCPGLKEKEKIEYVIWMNIIRRQIPEERRLGFIYTVAEAYQNAIDAYEIDLSVRAIMEKWEHELEKWEHELDNDNAGPEDFRQAVLEDTGCADDDDWKDDDDREDGFTVEEIKRLLGRETSS